MEREGSLTDIIITQGKFRSGAAPTLPALPIGCLPFLPTGCRQRMIEGPQLFFNATEPSTDGATGLRAYVIPAGGYRLRAEGSALRLFSCLSCLAPLDGLEPLAPLRSFSLVLSISCHLRLLVPLDGLPVGGLRLGFDKL